MSSDNTAQEKPVGEENMVENLQTIISNLEKEISTLYGENDRLTSQLKNALKQKELNDEEEMEEKSIHVAKATEDQAKHIKELETKLKMYDNFEGANETLEKQLNEYKTKANNYLTELTAVKSEHALVIKDLKERLTQKSAQKDDHDDNKHDPENSINLNINIVACEDHEGEDDRDISESTHDLKEKNDKLKLKVIQEKKISKRMQEEMEAMKEELFGLQDKHDEQHQYISNELKNLRSEIKQKMDLINVLENNNRELEVRARNAEDQSREIYAELQQLQEQNSEEQDKFGDKDEQIAQMHEDMQRLLDFKNELEALIEEQNKDIEVKSEEK